MPGLDRRSRRLTAAAVAAALLCSGCSAGASPGTPSVGGGVSSTPASPTGATASPGATTSNTGSPGAGTGSPATTSTAGSVEASGSPTILESAFAIQPAFTGPAVTRFGQASVQSAYREVVNFAFRVGWNPTWIARRKLMLTHSEFDPVLAYLTPTARTAVVDTLKKVATGDSAAHRRFEELVFLNVVGPANQIPVQTGKVVVGRRFTAGSASVDNRHGERLAITFAARADINSTAADGHAVALRTSRTLRFLLVPNTGPSRAAMPFLIDAMSAKVAITPVS